MLNFIVDTENKQIKCEVDNYLELKKIKDLIVVLEGIIKHIAESIYKKNYRDYEAFKILIQKYFSDPENYLKTSEKKLFSEIRNKAFLKIKGRLSEYETEYWYSDIEDLVIALMIIFENVYNRIVEISFAQSIGFRNWAIEEIGATKGNLMWNELELCILD